MAMLGVQAWAALPLWLSVLLVLAIDLAKENGLDLAVVPAARKMFQRAEAAGWGKDDATRVLEVYEGKDK